MLALVRSSVWAQVWRILLLSCAAAALASCATKEPPPLISDSASRETALPWNEQQKWEREGEASAITQQRR